MTHALLAIALSVAGYMAVQTLPSAAETRQIAQQQDQQNQSQQGGHECESKKKEQVSS